MSDNSFDNYVEQYKRLNEMGFKFVSDKAYGEGGYISVIDVWNPIEKKHIVFKQTIDGIVKFRNYVIETGRNIK